MVKPGGWAEAGVGRRAGSGENGCRGEAVGEETVGGVDGKPED